MTSEVSPPSGRTPLVPVPAIICDAARTPSLGTTLGNGKYLLRRKLGEGGMGIVYEAEDVRLERRVAIKLLTATVGADPVALQRFLLEARAAARLNHPNVVAIYEVDQCDGAYYIVMELVRGRSAEAVQRTCGALSWLEATHIVAHACRGLSAAHAAGLIHRDIKPANILIAADGDVKLADFGLAKMADHKDKSLTGTGFVLGTPHFMSPEQCRCEPLDERSDIYALGATYFALLTGGPPFVRADPMAVMFAHCSGTLPNPRDLRPDLPELCTTIVQRALAKYPTRRYASAVEMLHELQVLLAMPLVPVAASNVLSPASVDTPTKALKPIKLPSEPGAATQPQIDSVQHAPAFIAVPPKMKKGRWLFLIALSVVLPALLLVVVWGSRRTQEPASPASLDAEPVAMAEAPSCPSTLDRLRRENIAPYELTVAGGGDKGNAPAELVGVLGDSRLKHWGHVNCMAFSPDGATLASGGRDATIKLWDTATGKERSTLAGHQADVLCVAYSAQGRLLASGSSDGTVKLWQPGQSRELRTLRGHLDLVTGVAFRADGQELASISQDGTLKFWDVATGAEQGSVQAAQGPLFALAISRAGQLVATGGSDGTIKLWDSTTHQLVRVMRGHKGIVFALAFRLDELLASGGQDATIKLWEIRKVAPPRTLLGHAYGVTAVAFGAQRDLLISGSQDGTVKTWDSGTGTLWQTLPTGSNEVSCVAFDSHRGWIALGTAHGTVKLYDQATSNERFALSGHQGLVNAVAIRADGAVAASAGLDGAVKLWETASGKEMQTLPGHPSGIYSLAFAGRGATLAYGTADGAVHVWDTAAGKRLHTLRDSRFYVWSVAFSADGKLLACGNENKQIVLWDAETGKLLRTFSGHTQRIVALTFRPDGRLLASSGDDGTIRLWDLTADKEAVVLTGKHGRIAAIAFAPDGRTLASASVMGALHLWDVATRKARSLEGHEGSVFAVAFSPDGRILASSGWDGTLRCWDPITATARDTIRLVPRGGPCRQIIFAADSRHLLTANANGTVYVLRLPH